jgi:hypothetical protein
MNENMLKKGEVETETNEDEKIFSRPKEYASYLIPGKVNFDQPQFIEKKVQRRSSFSKMMTLNPESVLSQIEYFGFLKNTESQYYYQLDEKSGEDETQVVFLKKIIGDLHILLDQNKKYSSCKENEKKTSIFCDTFETINYIEFLLKNMRSYGNWCKLLLKMMIEIVLKRSEEIINKHLKTLTKGANLILNEEQIKKTFSEYFYTQINDYWFKKESFVEDKTFRITCEVLEFINLENLISIKNSKKIEKHLQGSIESLKELDYTFSLDEKFLIIQKVLENISYLIHYTNDTEYLPGNEVILNVFIWCIIRAKNSTLKSTLRYLELFIEDQKRLGEMGFSMTQLEASIIYIGTPP